MVSTTGYEFRSIVKGADSAGAYLSAESINDVDPLYFKEDIADHVVLFLKETNPELRYCDPQSLPGGQLSIIGYGKRQKAGIGINVRAGENRFREVVIRPIINPDGFLDTYKSVLERDLVSE